jgi:lysophospholipase L1-like esterase
MNSLIVLSSASLGALAALTAATAATSGPAGADRTLPPSDRRIRYEGRWDLNRPDRAVAVNPGSGFRLRWSGPSLALRFETAQYPVPTERPHLWLKTEDREWEEREVADRVVVQADGDGPHQLEVLFKGVREWDARWTPPLTADLDFRGVELVNKTKLLSSPSLPKTVIEFLGDSITEGVLVHPAAPGRESWPFRTDARLGYAYQTARMLGAQARPAGFGSLGISRPGNGGVPKALDAFPYVYAGVPVHGPDPAVAVINLGTNDRGMEEGPFADAYATYVAAVRARYPRAKIVCLEPFNGTHGAAIRSVVERLRSGGDGRVYYQETAGWVRHPEDTTDGVHPNEEGHRRAAERLAEALRPLLSNGRAPTKAVSAPRWIRPAASDAKPVWGIEGGIRFSLWPVSIEGKGDGGPRGLVRVGYPVLSGGTEAGLVNFLAVEPEVEGHPKGFSELERSSADGKPGKPMNARTPDGATEAGTVSHPDPRRPEIERLSVTVRMERFANGAHPYLVLSIQSDRPDELRVQVFHEPDSAPMKRCIITATMGNYARLRRLTLRDGVADSRKLYGDYKEDGFARDEIFPADRLRKNRRSDLIAPFTTDERDPTAAQPFPNSDAWRWRGVKVTQYWRKEAGTFGPDLQLRVNARYAYWMSRQPIPGGVAFENAELRETYHPGQEFIFGITRRTPGDLFR